MDSLCLSCSLPVEISCTTTSNFGASDLFGFPSAEKIRLPIAVDKVESKVNDLKMENAKLLKENELLRMENNRLNLANQPAKDDVGNVPKRARHG